MNEKKQYSPAQIANETFKEATGKQGKGFQRVVLKTKKGLISAMKKIQFTAQYIALERRDNGAIDAHFSVYPRVEYK